MINGKVNFLNPCNQRVIWQLVRRSVAHTNVVMPKNPPAKASEQPQRATHPPDERPHKIATPNPDDPARWLALADTTLKRGASAVDVAETEVLARKEQTAIKRRIRRRAEQVHRHSKSQP